MFCRRAVGDMVRGHEEGLKIGSEETQQSIQALSLSWAGEEARVRPARVQWGVTGRGQGERTAEGLWSWGGEEMETGRQAFVRMGGPRCPSQRSAQGHTAVIAAPLIPWFTNLDSSFRHLVACLQSVFPTERFPDPLRGQNCSPPRSSSQDAVFLGSSRIISEYFHVFFVFHAL